MRGSALAPAAVPLEGCLGSLGALLQVGPSELDCVTAVSASQGSLTSSEFPSWSTALSTDGVNEMRGYVFQLRTRTGSTTGGGDAA